MASPYTSSIRGRPARVPCRCSRQWMFVVRSYSCLRPLAGRGRHMEASDAGEAPYAFEQATRAARCGCILYRQAQTACSRRRDAVTEGVHCSPDLWSVRILCSHRRVGVRSNSETLANCEQHQHSGCHCVYFAGGRPLLCRIVLALDLRHLLGGSEEGPVRREGIPSERSPGKRRLVTAEQQLEPFAGSTASQSPVARGPFRAAGTTGYRERPIGG